MRLLLAFWPLFALQADEEGFEKVFNGADLSGLKFMFSAPDHEPGRTFRAEDGVLVCSGQPVGYFRTAKSYGEFILRFDWRFVRPPDLEDDAQFEGNSGYLLFMQDEKIWPKSLEVQGMYRDVGGIIPMDVEAESQTDAEARERGRRPVGEWNSMEIVSKGGRITVTVNGALVSTVTRCDVCEGPIGFQVEGSEIHWRNIRIRAE
jgi:hypothetical protein